MLDNQASVVYLGWYVVIIEIWGYHPTVLKILEWSIPSLGRAFNQLSTQAECVLLIRNFWIAFCLYLKLWNESSWLLGFQSKSGTRPKKWFRTKTRFYTQKWLMVLGNGYSVSGKDSAGLTLSVQSAETLWLNATRSENSNRFRSFQLDLATLMPLVSYYNTAE